MKKQTIIFEIEKLDEANWFIASSDDLRGVFAQGASVEEIRRRIPRLVRTFLIAQGHTVDSVTTRKPVEKPLVRKGKAPLKRIKILTAEARLEAA